MKRSILFASLAPALLIGGCMGTENRGMESVHQPVVARSDYVLDMATARGALAAGEQQRLHGWLDAMRLGYGDRIAIDDPSATAPVAREEVAGVVAGYGLLLSEDTPVSAAPITPSTIRVIVSRMRAGMPGCPDWSRDESHEFDANTSSNHGCAVNGNLAAMVAAPGDLVRGQGNTQTDDSTTSYKAIQIYRRAAPTGGGNTVKSDGTGGK